MTSRVPIANLQVDICLQQFVERELLPRLQLDATEFWRKFAALVETFTARNTALLARRDELQAQIDQWHRERRQQGVLHDPAAYQQFLTDIGYLLADCGDVQINTANVDPEISMQAGPQLVVPVKNARFALNATNARWGSLYDALYGTDAVSEDAGAERSGGYNPVRGEKVIAMAREFLDLACPLQEGAHTAVNNYSVRDGELLCRLEGGGETTLRDPRQLQGLQGSAAAPTAILLKNNNLHIEIQIDPASEIGATDIAGVKDVVLEAAVTTIQDCEDSVAAVDAEDKVEVYRNWLGLNTGELEETFLKGGVQCKRRLNADRQYQALNGEAFTLPGRSLMLVRNVGHLMRNPAVIDANGEEIYEGILDAIITAAVGSIDLNKNNALQNSRAGSVYIVKPKMHGPDEVQFTCDLFSAVEEMLGIPKNALKIGIMDEERRTTLSLQACISVAKNRVVFINTGFLDRTGDEIHTSMEAGPVVPKAKMKATTWIGAYEDNNVDVGLKCGLSGKAQIGKGMWAMPDLMAEMMRQKVAHPQAGANTAWVPSPTAAVLHAMHYHQVSVPEVQASLMTRPRANLHDLITLPLLAAEDVLSAEEIQAELDNNAQGILGYVVRWVDQGIGCSKVPDIHNIGLMEDRATLRISSQHIANWLHHGLCSTAQVEETLLRMAAVVDAQNAADPLYQAMAVDPENSIAFQSARELVFAGNEQPNGYTEPVLHRARLARKAQIAGA